jgi:hypothetical protein
MRLPTGVLALGACRIDDLVTALPEADSPVWNKARFRQDDHDVHARTRSIVFSWLDNAWQPGDPMVVVEADWGEPKLAAAVRACAAELLQRRPGKIAKLVLAELSPGAVIKAHVDDVDALTLAHRCHVPIVSNEQVVFSIDGIPYYLEPGKAYEIDNTRRHAVENRSAQRRVHLLCDIMPPQYDA